MASEEKGRFQKVPERLATVAAGLILGVLLAAPASVQADGSDKAHRKVRHEKRVRAYHERDVPRQLLYKDRRALRPYYAGRVYFRPHHHEHVAYHFPVFVDGVVAYRPYYYCENQLFLTGVVSLPRLAVSVQFGTPGIVHAPGYSPVPHHHQHDDDCEEQEDDEDEDDD